MIIDYYSIITQRLIMEKAEFNTPKFLCVGGIAQWLERWSMTGKLSLACTMTCS